MATKIGDLYFEVTADTSGARGSINSMSAAARDSGGIIAGALTQAFTAVGIAATAAAAITVGALAKVGAEFNIAGQQATGLFTALTGGLEEATAMLREFGQLALDSPIFDAAGLQKTTSLLLTFGIAKDDVVELAKNINLAAIGLGRGALGAQQIARALGQIQGRGWLEGDEARQLSEVGINAYAVIGEAIGKTTAETIELGRQSKLLAEDVIPILSAKLEETFGPVAQNMLNTYGVQAQGLKNIFQGVGSALVEPFIGRTAGGVVTEFLTNIRNELDGVIVIAEDGTYRLTGALEPLMDVTQALADGFEDIGNSITGALGELLSGDGLEGFASNLAEQIPAFVDGVQAFTVGAGEFFSDMWSALQPILPSVERLAEILFDFGQDGVPTVSEGLVNLVTAVAPLVAELAEIGTALLEIASPALISALGALTDVLSAVSDIIKVLAPLVDSFIAIWVSWKAAVLIAELATASMVTVALSPLAVALLRVAGAASVALAAVGAYNAITAGVTGNTDWLSEDVAFYEKPFQWAGRYGYALGGGDRSRDQNTAYQEDALARGQAFAESNALMYDSLEEFTAAASLAGIEVEALASAIVAYGDITEANDQAVRDSLRPIEIRNNFLRQYAGESETAADATYDLTDSLSAQNDLLRQLQKEADAAWDAVKQFADASSSDPIGDLFRDLPQIGEELTDAFEIPSDIFRNLEVGGITNDLRGRLTDIVIAAAEGGMGFDQIARMFDERGLEGVLTALGDAATEVVEEIDPIIRQYSTLDATAEQLNDAVRTLNDQRTTAIKAQIDQVSAALDDAKEAADEARQALIDFFTGGYGDSVQAQIDKLVLDIPGIGDTIEKANLIGGAQGDAMIRQAFGELGEGAASIFQTGLEKGMSPEEIIGMLGPVFESIDQELGSGNYRIASLDWSAGFTPDAAAALNEAFGGMLDPAIIQNLFDSITGSDANVSGLESQLEGLQASLQIDVTFSPEQVQGVLDEMYPPTTTLEPVVTDEAIQLLFDEIQNILDDDELKMLINEALLKQDITNTAQAAADSLTLQFSAGLSFDLAQVMAQAQLVGGEFATVLDGYMKQYFAERAAQGFEVPVSALQTTFGTNPVSTQPSIQIDAPITVNGATQPIPTATEIVSGLSAAASGGGRLRGVSPGTPVPV